MIKRSPKQWFYLVYFWILGLIAIHFMLHLGLSFANLNGCYRSYTPTSGILTPVVLAYFDPLPNTMPNISMIDYNSMPRKYIIVK